MKQINNYIQEKLKINKSVINKNQNILYPETKDELITMIHNEISKNGFECSLNHIDTSKITDMSFLFSNWKIKNFDLGKFNGDISDWDLSNVENTAYMFESSIFTGENSDISSWDVSNVIEMRGMFRNSRFNADISSWDVSNVKNMDYMFYHSRFNGDLSKWNVSEVTRMSSMFYGSKFTGENGGISNWNISKVENMSDMFASTNFNSDISNWKINPECNTMWMFFSCSIEKKYKPKLPK